MLILQVSMHSIIFRNDFLVDNITTTKNREINYFHEFFNLHIFEIKIWIWILIFFSARYARNFPTEIQTQNHYRYDE